MLSIQTNVNSLVAQENLRVNSNFQSMTIQRLTSGYRINSAGDDAAGLAVANKYRSDIAELTQGVRNANDAASSLQIVDGGITNITKMLDRLKTLATQSASDTFTGDRNTLKAEFTDVLAEIDRQAKNINLDTANTTWSAAAKVYIGGGSGATVTIDLSAAKVDTAGMSLGAEDISTSAGATTAITDIDTAVKTIGGYQGTVGAAENKLGYAIQLAQSQISNFSSAQSQIRDADMAAEAANLTKAQVLQQASLAAMAQANSAPQAVLSLLKG